MKAETIKHGATRPEDREASAPGVNRAENPAVLPIPPGRDDKGRFLRGNQIGTCTSFGPGNSVAATHWLHAADLPREFEHLRADLLEFLNGAVADDGGPSEVPTRRRSLLEYRGRIHRRIGQLDAAIELRGLFDKRGKLRAAWLQRLEGLITTAKALDSLLGLERKPKHLTLAELLVGQPDDERTPKTGSLSER